MQPTYWQTRWQNNPNPSFNQAEVNKLLKTQFATLAVAKGGRVFVPLCGKTIDMVWLAQQGYDVVGVELVESAVQQFFAEQHIEAEINQHGELALYHGTLYGQSIDLWVGDIFSLQPEHLGKVDAIYDRAALVALPDASPENLRSRYAKQLIKLTQTAPQLIVTFDYEQTHPEHPPFVLDFADLTDLYGEVYHIKKISTILDTLHRFKQTEPVELTAWRLVKQG